MPREQNGYKEENGTFSFTCGLTTGQPELTVWGTTFYIEFEQRYYSVINNVEHVELCKVYSIAGIDPADINHIDSPVGTRLIRKSSEEFEEDRNQPAFMEKWR